MLEGFRWNHLSFVIRGFVFFPLSLSICHLCLMCVKKNLMIIYNYRYITLPAIRNGPQQRNTTRYDSNRRVINFPISTRLFSLYTATSRKLKVGGKTQILTFIATFADTIRFTGSCKTFCLVLLSAAINLWNIFFCF